MSGRKFSPYQLEQESQRRNQLVSSCQAAKRRIVDLLAELEQQTQTLAAESGPSDHEMASAATWLRAAQTESAIHRNQAFSDSIARLSQKSHLLERLEAEGIQRNRDLTAALVKRALARRKAEADAAARAQEKLARDRVETASGTLTRFLTEVSPGLEESFPAEANALRQAAERLAAARNNRGAELEAALAGATSAGAQWNSAMETAEERKAYAQTRIGEVEIALAGHGELLQSWLGNDFKAAREHDVAAARQALEQGRVVMASRNAGDLAKQVLLKLEECENLEALRQRREFVATSLVQACQQLNFGILDAPRLENPGDPQSALRLVVDTFDEGQIAFRISLDSIESESCISKSYCFDEFDRLSQHLEAQFGISTKFEMADGSPRPKNKAQGELDEPSGGRTIARKA